jgi:hypothetical protein
MGVIPQGSSVQGIATAPEFIWEAFLGLWLTFKGFSAAPITWGNTRPAGVDGARAVAASAV